MKGDFSRRTFDRARHYSGVAMQQGRVQLDADWNEQGDIVRYRTEIGTRDLVGSSGGPQDDAGFNVYFKKALIPADDLAWLTAHKIAPASDLDKIPALDFLLGRGRYYVDGILCEIDHAVPYSKQPDLLDPLTIKLTAGKPGSVVAYLDVWQRHITALDDDLIREVALGGPDTTTRMKTVWQVRVVTATDGSPLSCLDAWTGPPAASNGLLAASVKPADKNADPCKITASAGYRGLENQLYRVEIHEPGVAGVATFKWSRENGSVATKILSVDPLNSAKLTVADLGRDDVLGFTADQWVEITDDGIDLGGTPRRLYRISGAPDAVNRTITLTPAPATIDFSRNPKLRLWNQSTGVTANGVVKTSTTPVELELGVQVAFSDKAEGGKDCNYKVGDYWLIPARTANGDPRSGNVEWPRKFDPVTQKDSTDPLPLPPRGIVHRYAPIAILDWDGATWSARDTRRLFPPVTALTTFQYLGGDGQEVMPDLTVPSKFFTLSAPLQVGVWNGKTPIAGAQVAFEPQGDSGRISLDPSGSFVAGKLTASTVDGIAKVWWQLNAGVAHKPPQVIARLLDPCGNPTSLGAITFTANLSVASQVAYDPGNCDGLKDPTNVQDAITTIARDRGLYMIGGDGQVQAPGLELALPLEVGVKSHCGPADGAKVHFVARGGVLSDGQGQTGSDITVKTGGGGLASVRWTPDAGGDPEQQTTATLLDQSGKDLPFPVKFTASLDRGGGCCTVSLSPDPKGHIDDAERVQKAIEHLPREGGTICLKQGVYNFRRTVVIKRPQRVVIEGCPEAVLVGKIEKGPMFEVAAGATADLGDAATLELENVAILCSSAGPIVYASGSIEGFNATVRVRRSGLVHLGEESFAVRIGDAAPKRVDTKDQAPLLPPKKVGKARPVVEIEDSILVGGWTVGLAPPARVSIVRSTLLAVLGGVASDTLLDGAITGSVISVGTEETIRKQLADADPSLLGAILQEIAESASATARLAKGVGGSFAVFAPAAKLWIEQCLMGADIPLRVGLLATSTSSGNIYVGGAAGLRADFMENVTLRDDAVRCNDAAAIHAPWDASALEIESCDLSAPLGVVLAAGAHGERLDVGLNRAQAPGVRGARIIGNRITSRAIEGRGGGVVLGPIASDKEGGRLPFGEAAHVGAVIARNEIRGFSKGVGIAQTLFPQSESDSFDVGPTDYVEIDENRVASCNLGIYTYGPEWRGVENRIRGNTVVDSDEAGISSLAARRAVITGNLIVTSNGERDNLSLGISLQADEVVVDGNTVRTNGPVLRGDELSGQICGNRLDGSVRLTNATNLLIANNTGNSLGVEIDAFGGSCTVQNNRFDSIELDLAAIDTPARCIVQGNEAFSLTVRPSLMTGGNVNLNALTHGSPQDGEIVVGRAAAAPTETFTTDALPAVVKGLMKELSIATGEFSTAVGALALEAAYDAKVEGNRVGGDLIVGFASLSTKTPKNPPAARANPRSRIQILNNFVEGTLATNSYPRGVIAGNSAGAYQPGGLATSTTLIVANNLDHTP